MQRTEFVVSNRTVLKILLLIAAFLGALELAHLLLRELTWIGTAFFLALALEPAVSRLSRYMPKRNRGLAAAIVLLLVFGLVVFVVMALVPPLVRQTQDLIRQLPSYINHFQNSNNAFSNFLNEQHVFEQLKN